MSTKHLLRSFAGGEITPELAGRLDLVKYQTGLALCRNFVTLPHGPAARRPGTEFIAEVKDSTRKVRLIPFTFNTEQTAVLEFGHLYVRVHIGGGQLLEANKTITSIAGNVVTSTAHGYAVGDWVYINKTYYKITAVTTDTFTLTKLDGSVAAPTGTNAARVFTVVTPYQEADLFDLHYAQSADVVTITHPNYAARELARQSSLEWTLTEIDFAPPAGVPTGVSASPTVAVDQNRTIAKYVVTGVKDDGVTESLPSSVATASNNLTLAGNFNTISWTGASGYTRYNVYKLRGGVYGYIGQVKPTGATPKTISSAVGYQLSGFLTTGRVRVITATAHDYSTGDRVLIEGTNYFDGLFAVTVEDSTTFTYSKNAAAGLSASSGTASVPSLSLIDDNVMADTTQSPPEDIIALNNGTGDYPAATVYNEQRRWFAGTTTKPQVLWATRTGTDANLTSSIPTRDADGMEVRVASGQYNSIRHLVALSDLIALTAGGEFRIFADGAPAITPTSISIKPQGYSGASNVQPAVTTGTVMYVQAQGSRIRELSYSWEASAYKSTDASIMAPHRFDYYSIKDLAFSRAPDSVLWAVRDDGAMLGMTYVPEQQVYGWHAHDTDGKFESVTVVPEGNEDKVYVVAQREIDGRSVRYIERLASRYFPSLESAYFVDSGSMFKNEQVAQFVTVTNNTPAQVYKDPDVYSCIYHFRKVGNQIWIFEDTQAGISNSEYPATIRRVDAITGELIDITRVNQVIVYDTSKDGGYGLAETDTHFWLFGAASTDNYQDLTTAKVAVKVAKGDPTDQTTYPITDSYLSPAHLISAFQSNDGTGVWFTRLTWDDYTGDIGTRAFYLWDLATQRVVSARTHMQSMYHDWQLSQFAADHLPNGEIAFIDWRRTNTGSPAYTRVVFLAENGSAAELPLPAGTIPAGLTLTDVPNEVWVLTNNAVHRIDGDAHTILNSTTVEGWVDINPYANLNSWYKQGCLAYDVDSKMLAWMRLGSAWNRVDLVRFDTVTRTQISRTVNIPNTQPGNSWQEWNFEIRFIDGELWFGGQNSNSEEEAYLVYRIPAGAPGEVGKVFSYYDANNKFHKYTVMQVISPTRAYVSSSDVLPGVPYEIDVPLWYLGVQTISGLDHLEGKTVQILADGAVHPTRVVTNGTISLEYKATIVTIGLQYSSDLRTLPLAIEGAQAAGQGTVKNINAVHLRVSKSSLVQAGPSFDRLREYPARAVTDDYGAPPGLRDGELSLSVDPSWSTDAALCVRQDEPLPLTVVSMTLEVQTGG